MKFSRITHTDQLALKSFRDSHEFKRIWKVEFAAHCAERRLKVEEMEREEPRRLAHQAHTGEVMLRAQEKCNALNREFMKASDEARAAYAEHMGASLNASRIRTDVERELLESSHADIREILSFVMDVREQLRHTSRTVVRGFERNILGVPLKSVWTDAPEITQQVEKLAAIEVALRRLQVTAYDERLVDILRDYYKQALRIARANNLHQTFKIETIEEIKDDA